MISHGTESVVLTYTEEGPGVRRIPVAIHVAARTVGWLHGRLWLQKLETPDV